VVYFTFMSRDDPQMKIRLPLTLKDKIEAAAKNSGRSMNAEIVARLGASFRGVDTTDFTPDQVVSIMKALNDRMVGIEVSNQELLERLSGLEGQENNRD